MARSKLIKVFAIAAVGSVLSPPAVACVCFYDYRVLPLAEQDGPTIIPANGVFRLHEGDLGAVEEDQWGIYDADGAPVPFAVERFEEPLGHALVELWPDEPLTEGASYTLRTPGSVAGSTFEVEGGPDETPPELTDAWFERVNLLKNTSCGEMKWTSLGVEPSPEPHVLIRIRDPKTGLYWHRAGLEWNPTCGGYPPHMWSGRKEVVLVDRAGNESEIAGTRVCGCSADKTPSLAPAAFLGVLILPRRRKR